MQMKVNKMTFTTIFSSKKITQTIGLIKNKMNNNVDQIK